MRLLGIIGGIAPGSTIDYYRLIIDEFRERRNREYPQIIINSIPLDRMIGLVTSGRLEELADMMTRELQRLAAAGAEIALLASNTPHLVFDELRRRSSIPLISIVEEASKAARAAGFSKLGLFGTRFTMAGRFYSEVFEREGMSVVSPPPDDQEFIHERYMNELANGLFLPETRDALSDIASRLIDEQKIEGLILAGTELPLILRETSISGVPVLNTTAIHVRAAVDAILA